VITPGATVRINHHSGDWVVHSALGGRWKCIGRGVVGRDRQALISRIVGEGDIVVVKPAPTFAPGTTIEHNGVEHTVLADHGDTAELEVPSSRYPLKRGGHLHIAAGNTTTVTKAELVLAALA
jgi:signal peptidase I